MCLKVCQTKLNTTYMAINYAFTTKPKLVQPHFQTCPYLRPSPRKCWPISRIMSISERDIVLGGPGLSPESPFMLFSLLPFCIDTDWVSRGSPLCWGKDPFVCILAQVLSFFRGGGVTPPLSESEDDASMLSRNSKLATGLDA